MSKSNIAKSLAFVIVASLLFAAQGTSQRRRVDHPLPDDLYKLYEQKRSLIGQAVANTRNEWAGTYLAGDHHPTVFIWEPDSGFLVSSSLHTFTPSWINYGKVELAESSLTVYPELTKENSSAHLMPTKFQLVMWDKQHFLIPQDQLKSFAYDVHSGAESNIVHYFARAEGLDSSRRGLPDLSDELRGIMTMPAITARITSVGAEQGFAQDVTLGVGKRQKVIEGMHFYFSDRNGAQFTIRITEVSDRSSKGEVSSISTTGTSDNVEVKEGLKLSSKMPKGFIEPG